MKPLASLIPMASDVTMVSTPLLRVTVSLPFLVKAIEADICTKPAKLISA